MIALHEDGRVRSIGVSNFTEAYLTRVIDETDVIPAVRLDSTGGDNDRR
jgi:2,5-diketo-D-gluconate reductase A